MGGGQELHQLETEAPQPWQYREACGCPEQQLREAEERLAAAAADATPSQGERHSEETGEIGGDGFR